MILGPFEVDKVYNLYLSNGTLLMFRFKSVKEGLIKGETVLGTYYVDASQIVAYMEYAKDPYLDPRRKSKRSKDEQEE